MEFISVPQEIFFNMSCLICEKFNEGDPTAETNTITFSMADMYGYDILCDRQRGKVDEWLSWRENKAKGCLKFYYKDATSLQSQSIEPLIPAPPKGKGTLVHKKWATDEVGMHILYEIVDMETK